MKAKLIIEVEYLDRRSAAGRDSVNGPLARQSR